MEIKSFKDLVVWRKSMVLVEEVYALSRKLPKSEMFGLASQLQRASVSIPSNIAEGTKRGSRADFRQFCRIAHGSAAELETLLMLSQNLYQLKCDSLLVSVTEIQKMLTALISKL